MEGTHLYIVLTRTNTVISRLIRLFTQDEYTHAALSLDKELDEMYSFARKWAYNPFIGRFKRERLDEGLYKVARQLPGTIIEIDVSNADYLAVRRIIDHFIANQTEYKYNFIGLFYGLFKIPAETKNKFLCSQFVYYVLNESGIIEFNKSANLVRPVDFLSLNGNIIFQGNLKQFAVDTHYLPTRVRFVNWCRDRWSEHRVG